MNNKERREIEIEMLKLNFPQLSEDEIFEKQLENEAARAISDGSAGHCISEKD